MRVQFKADGGVAFFPGLSKPTTIDSDDLSPAEAAKLKHEMEAAQAEEERASHELSKQQEALERETREAEEQMQGLAAEEHVHELRAGTDELVRSLTQQVTAIKEELPQATAQKAQLEREIRRLEAAIAALAKTP